MSMYNFETLKGGNLSIREMLKMDIDWHPAGQRDTQGSTPEKETAFIDTIMNGGYLGKMAIASVYDKNGEFNDEYRVLDGSHRAQAIERFKNNLVWWTPPGGDQALLWNDLDKSQKNQFLDYDKLDVVVYKDLTPEEEGKVFRIWNDGLKIGEEEYLNSFSIEIRNIIRVLVRGDRAQVGREPVLTRLGRHKQHPLLKELLDSEGLSKGAIERHKIDTVLTKLFVIAFKKFHDEKNIYEFTNDVKLRRSLYVGPNESQGLWAKMAENDPDMRDECVEYVVSMLDQVHNVMSKAPNGLGSFKKLAAFDGFIYHMIGLEIYFNKPFSKIVSDKGKYAAAWLDAHAQLMRKLPGNRQSDYDKISGKWWGHQWRSKFAYVMQHVMDNGGLESMSIKPATDRKRAFDEDDKIIAWNRQEGDCVHCGEPLDWNNMHAHHSPIPHSMGGLTIPENCELLHVECHNEQHGH